MADDAMGTPAATTAASPPGQPGGGPAAPAPAVSQSAPAAAAAPAPAGQPAPATGPKAPTFDWGVSGPFWQRKADELAAERQELDKRLADLEQQAAIAKKAVELYGDPERWGHQPPAPPPPPPPQAQPQGTPRGGIVDWQTMVKDTYNSIALTDPLRALDFLVNEGIPILSNRGETIPPWMQRLATGAQPAAPPEDQRGLTAADIARQQADEAARREEEVINGVMFDRQMAELQNAVGRDWLTSEIEYGQRKVKMSRAAAIEAFCERYPGFKPADAMVVLMPGDYANRIAEIAYQRGQQEGGRANQWQPGAGPATVPDQAPDERTLAAYAATGAERDGATSLKPPPWLGNVRFEPKRP